MTTERERVARALRWLAVAALLYPLGRAVVDPIFAALGRPVPGIAARGVAALYLAIPAAALVLATRIVGRRARRLLHTGAALSVFGLALEWAPVRFESVVGSVFSFANDTSINAGVAALAMAVMAVGVKARDAERRSAVHLEGSVGITVAVLIEIVWTRARGPSTSAVDRSAVAYVASQIAFVTPLLLLAAGAFVRAHAGAGDGFEHDAERRPHLARTAGSAAVAAIVLLVLGASFSAPRLVWTLGVLAACGAVAVLARPSTRQPA